MDKEEMDKEEMDQDEVDHDEVDEGEIDDENQSALSRWTIELGSTGETSETGEMITNLPKVHVEVLYVH